MKYAFYQILFLLKLVILFIIELARSKIVFSFLTFYYILQPICAYFKIV